MQISKFTRKSFHVRDEAGNVYSVSEIRAYGKHNQTPDDSATELYRKYRFESPDLVKVSISKQSKNTFLRQDNKNILKRVAG